MKKQFIVTWLLLCLLSTNVKAQVSWSKKPSAIETRWAKKVNPSNVLPEYPRPQLVRTKWTNLNGLWDYAITNNNATFVNNFDGKILVPYPIESSLSGVKKRLEPNQLLWYKRNINKPVLKRGERVLLHFGAVDFEATVFVNGEEVGNHRGGYQNFSFDITDHLNSGSNELTVRVWDPTDQGPNPHGKQVLNPQGIMYTPSSGIWQTVWMEIVPQNYIESLTITPDVNNKHVRIKVNASVKAAVILNADGKTLKGKANEEIVFPLTTLKLWSPDQPYLYDLIVTMGVDKVKSYFGMRKIEVKKDEKGIDRIFLNNRYTYNLGTLDQGFWPDGLYTAPTDDALQFDIKAIKAMGFNTIRKHIKIEPARWYYYCDKLGMMVWQDMVNPGNDSEEGHKEFEKECKENIAQLFNHPSITTWVLFNEKWGQYDQARLTKWLKAEDPTRLVNGHSGEILYVNDQLRSPSPDAWVGADMTDVHAYPNPGHMVLQKGKACVIGEFGGIGVPVEGHLWDDLVAGWGYDGVVTPSLMKKQYTYMVDSLKVLEQQGLSASIYTQPFDVESEQNGLITYDREIIKLPAEAYRSINERLWPSTENLAVVTKGFSAKVAEDKGSVDYATRLKEYQGGKKDSAFLRGLAIMALQQKDKMNISKLGNDYMQIIKAPLSDNNINFLVKVTNNDTDKGFSILLNGLAEIRDKQLTTKASRKIQQIVFNKEVKPLLTETPDWSKIDDIIAKYKNIDGEFVIGLSVVDYLNAAINGEPKGTTKNIVDVATIYDDRFHAGAYNQWAWMIFERSSKTSELTKALEWSKKSLNQEPTNAHYMDTYANLLYKIGKKEEALEWEKKALQLDPNSEWKNKAYNKMQKGEATWPASN